MLLIIILLVLLVLALIVDFTLQIKEEKDHETRIKAINTTLIWDDVNKRWN